MTDQWGPAAIGSVLGDDITDDGHSESQAIRRVRGRGVLAVLVILFTAGLVLTSGLPAYR